MSGSSRGRFKEDGALAGLGAIKTGGEDDPTHEKLGALALRTVRAPLAPDVDVRLKVDDSREAACLAAILRDNGAHVPVIACLCGQVHMFSRATEDIGESVPPSQRGQRPSAGIYIYIGGTPNMDLS